MNPGPDSSLIGAPRSSVVRVIGVGGAGGRLVHTLAQQVPSVSALAVDTDGWALRRLEQVSTVTLGEVVLRGLGCGGDAVQGAHVAEMDQARLKDLVSGTGLLVLVVGMGGGAGSGIAPVVAQLARDSGAMVVALSAVPFEFEGPLRLTNARQGLGALRKAADLVIPVSHQALLRTAPETAGAEELLQNANGLLLGLARELLRMLSGQSLIPLGIADLARLFRGRQAEGGIASAEASGAERVQGVWEQLMSHPLLPPVTILSQASTVVLHVAGGPDLKLDELEWLEQKVQQSVPRAQVLLGAVTQPELAGRLTALLVVAPAASGGPGDAMLTEDTPGGSRSSASRTGVLMFEDPTPAPGDSRRHDLPSGAERRHTGVGRGRSGGRNFQQQFDFAPRWRGRFEGAEGTLRGGENLDEPTFARRGVKLN